MKINDEVTSGRPPDHPLHEEGWRWVSAERWDWLEERMVVQTRRARRLGLTPPCLCVGDRVMCRKVTRDAFNKDVVTWHEWVEVSVHGEAPKLAGWRLIARVEHVTGERGTANVFHEVPDETVPATYREAGRVCEHCKTNRQRRDTFIVAHDDGRYMQVGRTCIADFLGHQNPAAYVAAAEWACQGWRVIGDPDDDGWEPGGMREYVRVPLEWVLSTTWRIIQVSGWRSGTAAREGGGVSTRSRLYDILNPPSLSGWSERAKAEHREWVAKVREVECDPAFIKAAIDWAAALPEESTGYLGNLRAIAFTELVSHQSMGLACSLIPAYQKHLDREIKRDEQMRMFPKPWAGSNHLGVAKERLELEVRCLRHYYLDGMYGTTVIHTMRTRGGDVVKWFCSNPDNKLPLDEWVRIKGTVKGHDTYKGVEETVLNRVTQLVPEPTS
jgi:hypothetical protein